MEQCECSLIFISGYVHAILYSFPSIFHEENAARLHCFVSVHTTPTK